MEGENFRAHRLDLTNGKRKIPRDMASLVKTENGLEQAEGG